MKSKLDSGHIRENIVLFNLNLKKFLVKYPRALIKKIEVILFFTLGGAREVLSERNHRIHKKMLLMVEGFNAKFEILRRKIFDKNH